MAMGGVVGISSRCVQASLGHPALTEKKKRISVAFFVLFCSRQFLWEVEGVVLGKKCKLVSKLTITP